MSARAQAWAMRQVAGSPVDKLVLMLIADSAYDGGWAPAAEFTAPEGPIPDMAEMSSDEVWMSVLRLEARGLLRLGEGFIKLDLDRPQG